MVTPADLLAEAERLLTRDPLPSERRRWLEALAAWRAESDTEPPPSTEPGGTYARVVRVDAERGDQSCVVEFDETEARTVAAWVCPPSAEPVTWQCKCGSCLAKRFLEGDEA